MAQHILIRYNLCKTRVCKVCDKEKPITEYWLAGGGRRRRVCKDCMKVERLRWLNRYAGSEKDKENRKRYYLTNRDKHNANMREWNNRLRMDAYKKLSDPPICKGCGIADIRVLTVDHIHNDGNIERRKLSDRQVWRKIMKMSGIEARETYQVLCRNCNWIKYREFKDRHPKNA